MTPTQTPSPAMPSLDKPYVDRPSKRRPRPKRTVFKLHLRPLHGAPPPKCRRNGRKGQLRSRMARICSALDAAAGRWVLVMSTKGDNPQPRLCSPMKSLKDLGYEATTRAVGTDGATLYARKARKAG